MSEVFDNVLVSLIHDHVVDWLRLDKPDHFLVGVVALGCQIERRVVLIWCSVFLLGNVEVILLEAYVGHRSHGLQVRVRLTIP